MTKAQLFQPVTAHQVKSSTIDLVRRFADVIAAACAHDGVRVAELRGRSEFHAHIAKTTSRTGWLVVMNAVARSDALDHTQECRSCLLRLHGFAAGVRRDLEDVRWSEVRVSVGYSRPDI